MGRKKKKNGSAIILGILVVGLGGYIAYDKGLIKDINNIINSNNKTNVKIEYPTVSGYEYVKKEIKYDNKAVDLSNYIENFYNDESNDDKLLNLTVDNIKLNNKNITFGYVNHVRNCTDLLGNNSYTDEYNRVYLNNELIMTQNNQACYLSRLDKLVVLDNSYLVLTINAQGGNTLLIYNDKLEKVSLATIKYISLENTSSDEVLFKGYDTSEPKLIINTYSLKVQNGELKTTIKTPGNKSYCDENFELSEPADVVEYCK